MAARSSSESNKPGIPGRLPHSDLLTFLCLTQKFHTNLLEYTPRYNDRDARVGGNAIVQIVHLSTDVDAAESLPSFAFKRHDLVGGLGPEDRLKKIICELIIYENPTIASHPNIADLRGISWSVDATRPGSLSHPTVSPVLGFHPSKGNLADVLAIANISFVKKLEICRDIGHALETLHSLNVAHGDLKPENVLIHEDSSMTAKLIDFDSSSFGLTDSDYVSISGTRVWRAPELVRRNPMVRLSEAFKADIYSFGKLCAWIMFHKVLNIEDYTQNAGRTSFQRYETFDLGRAVEHGQLQSDGHSQNTLTFPERSLLLLMEGFFSATFVGAPERRHGDVSEIVQLLEEVLEASRVMDIPGNDDQPVGRIGMIKGKALAYLRKLGLTTRPYRRSRYRITQLLLARIVRIKQAINGSNEKGLSFSDKQWVFRVVFEVGFVKVFRILHLIAAWILVAGLVLSMIWAIREHVRFGSNACQMERSTFMEALCYIGITSTLLFGVQILVLLIYFLRTAFMPVYLTIRRWFRPRRIDESFEMTDANILEIGHQVYRKSVSPGFWKTLRRTIEDAAPEPGCSPPPLDNDILPRLENRGKNLHLLPDLIYMGPLLNRLHYRLRLQIVDNLLQRLRCSTCHKQATDMLAACALLGFGNTRSIGNFPSTPGTVRQTLEKDLEADSSFKTSLPQLPFAVRNLIQDDRADLFTFDEMTSALQTILSELLTKMNIGTNCRSTQILSSTLGRLFTLIGRHEDAALCFYTALTHRPKPRWRTYNELSARLNLYAAPGDMRITRDSNQLIEAEHDLFLFSLVHELDILGREEEAIRELQGIRDITIAPNGLYLERETGRSFHIVIHRITDARNLLVRLLLEREMLGEIMHMGQEYDLPDLVGLYGYTPEVVPGQAQQCFATTEQVALSSFRCGRFDHAERLQRRLLSVCSGEKIHKSLAETNIVRADLALTLSRSEVVGSIEEANKIQQELIQLVGGEDRDLLFNVRLNNIYTLTALGHLDHALLQIEAVLEDDREWREILEITNQGTQTLRLGTPLLWLYEVPDGLRTTFVVHRALLATCPFIKEKEDQLKLIMLLCANPRTPTPLYNYKELIDFLASTILKSAASVLQQIVLWDRLICLLTCVGIGWELPEKFDLAQTCIDEMTNTVSIMSENHDVLENETHVVYLTALALRMKAQYLNAVRGFGITDHTFWDNAVNAHRRASLAESSKRKTPRGGFSLARLCQAGMLKQKVLAFHDSEEAQEAIECYSEIVQEHENLVFARVEYAHLYTELDLNDGSLTREEDPLQIALVECVNKLGSTHSYTNQARTMMAHSLEHRGRYAEARELLSEAAESVRTTMGTSHPQTLRAQFNLFKFQNKRQVELGRHPYSSLADLSSLRYSAAKILGKEHATTQEYLGCYALSLERDEKAVKEAIALKRDVVDALQRAHETAHTKLVQERSELAGMLCRQSGQDHLDGRSEFALSLRSAVNLLGVSHPTTREIWRQCVSAISDLGQESGKTLSSVAPPSEAITSPVVVSGHAHSPRPLDPIVYETYLSIYLLGTNHPLTTMLQNKLLGTNPLWTGSVPSDEDWKDYFPLPPPRQIREQWNEFLEPLRLIFNKQMAHHQQEIEAALEQCREGFAASGGLHLDFSGGHLGEEELPVLRVMRPEFGVMRA